MKSILFSVGFTRKNKEGRRETESRGKRKWWRRRRSNVKFIPLFLLCGAKKRWVEHLSALLISSPPDSSLSLPLLLETSFPLLSCPDRSCHPKFGNSGRNGAMWACAGMCFFFRNIVSVCVRERVWDEESTVGWEREQSTEKPWYQAWEMRAALTAHVCECMSMWMHVEVWLCMFPALPLKRTVCLCLSIFMLARMSLCVWEGNN